MALDTVQEYVDEARSLLSDEDEPYRYSDERLIRALNLGLLETFRLRPDAFINTLTAVPSYSDVGDTVALDKQYGTSLLYFMCGFTELGDVEDTEDARAAGLIGQFRSALTGQG